MEEAARHPHITSRQTIVERDGVLQPAPAPRFSRTPAEVAGPMPQPGADTDAVLEDWGFTTEEISIWRDAGAVWQASVPT